MGFIQRVYLIFSHADEDSAEWFESAVEGGRIILLPLAWCRGQNFRKFWSHRLNTYINLGKDVPDSMKDRVQRQLEYKFASLKSVVSSLHVDLSISPERSEDGVRYVCSMESRMVGGEGCRTEVQGKLPNICVADAAARLARKVGRDSVLKTLHRDQLSRTG